MGPEILIYYLQKGGNLLSKLILTTPIIVRGFDLGDVNNDGRTDLVVSGWDPNTLAGYAGRIMIYCQGSDGNLLPGKEIPISAQSAGDVKIGDVNGDGINDIVVLTNNDTLSIFYGTPNGGLSDEYTYQMPHIDRESEIQIADMNNDGLNDIIVQTGNLQLGVIRQDTNNPGHLLQPDYYSVETSYWPRFDSFAVGDINGDGKNDIVVQDEGNNGYLNLFIQNTAGMLTREILSGLNFMTYSVRIADINGDGLNDIVGEIAATGRSRESCTSLS